MMMAYPSSSSLSSPNLNSQTPVGGDRTTQLCSVTFQNCTSLISEKDADHHYHHHSHDQEEEIHNYMEQGTTTPASSLPPPKQQSFELQNEITSTGGSSPLSTNIKVIQKQQDDGPTSGATGVPSSRPINYHGDASLRPLYKTHLVFGGVPLH
eukprot:11160325-Ditylum_brightwellii.AAC.1